VVERSGRALCGGYFWMAVGRDLSCRAGIRGAGVQVSQW
jgi:hypothetical protein